MKIRIKASIYPFLILLLLQGCAFEYEPSIPTIGFQSPASQSQAFQSLGATPTDTPEMIELKEAVDLLFDPYRGTLPEDLVYKDSVYEMLNMALAEAYQNCGYNLESIASAINSNPMTEEKFKSCIVIFTITDPISLVEYSLYDWLEKRLIAGGENPLYSALLLRLRIDRTEPMNFEPNYLDALMQAYPQEVLRAKSEFMARLLEWNNQDASLALEYLQVYKHGLMGTE